MTLILAFNRKTLLQKPKKALSGHRLAAVSGFSGLPAASEARR
jgi:hypothetical protein